jgi:hypothetical protein
LVLISFLGLLGYFLFFDPDPARRIIIEDVSKPAVIRLASRYSDKSVHELNLTLVGGFSGRIKIEVCPSDTLCPRQATLSGKTTIRMNSDWYTPSCIVKLTPLEKSSGKVEITYRFLGI